MLADDEGGDADLGLELVALGEDLGRVEGESATDAGGDADPRVGGEPIEPGAD